MLIIGFVLSYFLNDRWGIAFADSFFVCSMLFIVVALWQIICNLGFFTGVTYGTKSFFRLFRNKIISSTELKDEYAEYVENRRKFTDMPVLFIIGLLLLLLAVVFS